MSVGIVSSAFMVSNFNLFDTVRALETTLISIFVTGGASVDLEAGVVNWGGGLFNIFSRWYFSILFFLLVLGIITSMVVITGGAKAFVESVSSKVKTRKGVQYLTVVTGILLMIDDYFNAMINGKIAKTLAKDHKLTRARAAYNVDSIAAPICIVAPVSTWAVAIMGNMEIVYGQVGREGNVFLEFLQMIPFQFYVFAAIGMVLITIKFDFNFLAMKKFEDRMAKDGVDLSADESGEELLGDAQSTKGTLADFYVPILSLVAATIATMVITGVQAAPAAQIAEYGLLYSILDNLSLSMSLWIGAIIGLVVTMFFSGRHVKKGEVTTEQFRKAIIAGCRSMATACAILVMSWMIASLIGRLDVGTFFANIVYNLGIYGGFIPFIMFITAALMAFSIGTSWGTFAIVLPIAGAVSAAIDINLLFPAMAAVLSGAVWGDHSSPISDTTILASAGTSSKVVAHFESQIPYALIAAAIAAIGFLAFGLAGNVFVGYLGLAAAFAVTIVFVRIYNSKQKKAA
jgi:tetracycline resistance efflux pump